ncbi:MAG: two-component system response regulator BtsR [Holophaga sp.]|nr:two-component system response regulator BtsR [Holophaga sp.]
MMRAVVVDNERNARRELETLLEERGDITLVGACANAIQAIRMIRVFRPEILFVDIHMPKLDGFQLVAMIEPEIMPCVVFVTAHDEYALKAFDENAIDYLLKPVQADRLARTVEKIRHFVGEGRQPSYRTPAITRIPCVCAQGVRFVDTSEVEMVCSSETGVHLVTARGDYLTELTLTLLEAKAPDMVRCHRQFLVNLAHIEQINRIDPATVMLRTRSGKQVPVSRRYHAGLKERLGI